MPFIELSTLPVIEPVPGVRMRTPHGQQLMLSFLEMDDGAEVPLHSHPHEQGGLLISGRMQLTIGGETRIVDPGSMFLIPGGVPHRAVAVGGPVVALDVFSPVREDYAALTNRYIPPVNGDRAPSFGGTGDQSASRI
jgi:quercetin dioxygenase-like cupin family protein